MSNRGIHRGVGNVPSFKGVRLPLNQTTYVHPIPLPLDYKAERNNHNKSPPEQSKLSIDFKLFMKEIHEIVISGLSQKYSDKIANSNFDCEIYFKEGLASIIQEKGMNTIGFNKKLLDIIQSDKIPSDNKLDVFISVYLHELSHHIFGKHDFSQKFSGTTAIEESFCDLNSQTLFNIGCKPEAAALLFRAFSQMGIGNSDLNDPYFSDSSRAEIIATVATKYSHMDQHGETKKVLSQGTDRRIELTQKLNNLIEESQNYKVQSALEAHLEQNRYESLGVKGQLQVINNYIKKMDIMDCGSIGDHKLAQEELRELISKRFNLNDAIEPDDKELKVLTAYIFNDNIFDKESVGLYTTLQRAIGIKSGYNYVPLGIVAEYDKSILKALKASTPEDVVLIANNFQEELKSLRIEKAIIVPNKLLLETHSYLSENYNYNSVSSKINSGETQVLPYRNFLLAWQKVTSNLKSSLYGSLRSANDVFSSAGNILPEQKDRAALTKLGLGGVFDIMKKLSDKADYIDPQNHHPYKHLSPTEAVPDLQLNSDFVKEMRELKTPVEGLIIAGIEPWKSLSPPEAVKADTEFLKNICTNLPIAEKELSTLNLGNYSSFMREYQMLIFPHPIRGAESNPHYEKYNNFQKKFLDKLEELFEKQPIQSFDNLSPRYLHEVVGLLGKGNYLYSSEDLKLRYNFQYGHNKDFKLFNESTEDLKHYAKSSAYLNFFAENKLGLFTNTQKLGAIFSVIPRYDSLTQNVRLLEPILAKNEVISDQNAEIRGHNYPEKDFHVNMRTVYREKIRGHSSEFKEPKGLFNHDFISVNTCLALMAKDRLGYRNYKFTPESYMLVCSLFKGPFLDQGTISHTIENLHNTFEKSLNSRIADCKNTDDFIHLYRCLSTAGFFHYFPEKNSELNSIIVNRIINEKAPDLEKKKLIEYFIGARWQTDLRENSNSLEIDRLFYSYRCSDVELEKKLVKTYVEIISKEFIPPDKIPELYVSYGRIVIEQKQKEIFQGIEKRISDLDIDKRIRYEVIKTLADKIQASASLTYVMKSDIIPGSLRENFSKYDEEIDAIAINQNSHKLENFIKRIRNDYSTRTKLLDYFTKETNTKNQSRDLARALMQFKQEDLKALFSLDITKEQFEMLHSTAQESFIVHSLEELHQRFSNLSLDKKAIFLKTFAHGNNGNIDNFKKYTFEKLLPVKSKYKAVCQELFSAYIDSYPDVEQRLLVCCGLLSVSSIQSNNTNQSEEYQIGKAISLFLDAHGSAGSKIKQRLHSLSILPPDFREALGDPKEHADPLPRWQVCDLMKLNNVPLDEFTDPSSGKQINLHLKKVNFGSLAVSVQQEFCGQDYSEVVSLLRLGSEEETISWLNSFEKIIDKSSQNYPILRPIVGIIREARRTIKDECDYENAAREQQRIAETVCYPERILTVDSSRFEFGVASLISSKNTVDPESKMRTGSRNTVEVKGQSFNEMKRELKKDWDNLLIEESSLRFNELRKISKAYLITSVASLLAKSEKNTDDHGGQAKIDVKEVAGEKIYKVKRFDFGCVELKPPTQEEWQTTIESLYKVIKSFIPESKLKLATMAFKGSKDQLDLKVFFDRFSNLISEQNLYLTHTSSLQTAMLASGDFIGIDLPTANNNNEFRNFHTQKDWMEIVKEATKLIASKPPSTEGEHLIKDLVKYAKSQGMIDGIIFNGIFK